MYIDIEESAGEVTDLSLHPLGDYFLTSSTESEGSGMKRDNKL